MKKDIDTIIAEERAEIIKKYEKASYILSVDYFLTFCNLVVDLSFDFWLFEPMFRQGETG